MTPQKRSGSYHITEIEIILFDNNDNDKITKLKNIKNLIRIWCDHKKILPHGIGGISLFIGNKYRSGYEVSKNTQVTSDVIQGYIDLLKDVIEEKVDEQVDDYSITKYYTIPLLSFLLITICFWALTSLS